MAHPYPWGSPQGLLRGFSSAAAASRPFEPSGDVPLTWISRSSTLPDSSSPFSSPCSPLSHAPNPREPCEPCDVELLPNAIFGRGVRKCASRTPLWRAQERPKASKSTWDQSRSSSDFCSSKVDPKGRMHVYEMKSMFRFENLVTVFFLSTSFQGRMSDCDCLFKDSTFKTAPDSTVFERTASVPLPRHSLGTR